MIHQLVSSAINELIGRLILEVGAQVAQGWSDRRAAHSPDLPLDGDRHLHQERHSYGARMIGPRYPGTF